MLLVLSGLPRPKHRWTSEIISCDSSAARTSTTESLDSPWNTTAGSIGKCWQRTIAADRLVDSGVRLLRFTAGDIYNSPDLVVRMVRKALAA